MAWLNGWGFNYSMTLLDPAETKYDPSTKTFTLYNYVMDGGSGAVAGWFTDTVRIVEMY